MRALRWGRAITGSTVTLALLITAACSWRPRPNPTTTTTTTAGATTTTGATTSTTAPGGGGGLRFGAPQEVATGLEVPWSIAFVDEDTMIVSERPGRFRLIDGGQLRPQPIGQVPASTAPAGEGGLMGIALHPQFPSQRFLYAMYTASTGNRVVRFPLGADFTLGAEEHLLPETPGSRFHDGGAIAFGPDGMLYVATGYGPDLNLAADRNSPNGKILRVTPEGDVPADNPFPGSAVWTWGHRNPQGMAWDSDGRMYASEHGPTIERAGLCCNDEINLIQKGAFYGWPYRAGTIASGLTTGSPPATPVDPIATSGTSTSWAPSNMAIWDGPGGTTHLYQASLRGSTLMHFVFDKASPSTPRSNTPELTGYGRLRAAKFGPDGCLYVSTSNRDGRGTPRAGDDRLLRLCPT
jgi:glucose/arabinose dehydrogenase